MEQYIKILCRYCGKDDLVKNGHSENGTQRYRCNHCKKTFQTEYSYNAWQPGVKEQIETQTLNSSGVRDIGRNLGISKNTVISELKKKTPAEINPYFIKCLNNSFIPELEVEIRADAEGDEFWSFVGNKGCQRWTWYAVEKNSGIILAWHNGRRTDESCALLMNKLSVFPVKYYYTDDWQSYKKYIPSQQHVIGKDNTWKIERKNLNFRTHIKRLSRKTICFSKNKKIHDNVIGMYINRYYFERGLFSETA